MNDENPYRPSRIDLSEQPDQLSSDSMRLAQGRRSPIHWRIRLGLAAMFFIPGTLALMVSASGSFVAVGCYLGSAVSTIWMGFYFVDE